MATKRNFLYNAAYQIVMMAVPIVTIPYLSRVLGQDGVGVYSYTNTVAAYFVTVATLGLSSYGVREIARCGTDREARSRCFWSIFAFQFLMGAAVSVCYLAYSAFVESSLALPTLMWTPYVLSTMLDVNWMFSGCEEFRIPVIRSLATKLLGVACIFLFVKTAGDAWIYCLCTSATYIVNVLVLWPFVRTKVDFRMPTRAEVLSHVKPNLVLFVPVVASTIYGTAGTVFLGNCASMDQTGLFNYAQRLCRLPLAFATSLGVVMMPRMTAAFGHAARPETERLLVDSSWIMLAMGFLFMWGIIGMAPEFVPVFLGDGFDACKQLMPALSIIIPVICMSNVMGNQYLLPQRRDRAYTASLCIGAAVFIPAGAAMIPAFGAMGAVLATDLAEIAVLAAQIALAHDGAFVARMFRQGVPFLAMGILMSLFMRLVAALCTAAFGVGVATLAIEIAAGGLSFGVMFVAWCLVRHDRRLELVLGRRLHAALFAFLGTKGSAGR
jgi:O-antigen/teichoic acid export membrane protein